MTQSGGDAFFFFFDAVLARVWFSVNHFSFAEWLDWSHA